jgi:hypothetical protein
MLKKQTAHFHGSGEKRRQRNGVRLMPVKERYKVKQVAEALRNAAGLKSLAAEQLGCVPSTITNYISRHKSLEKVEAEALEATLDLAEDRLIQNIREGKEASIFFYLKCKGKLRGYVEKDRVITLEALRRIMEKMALVVAHNVKNDEALQRIEEQWGEIRA